MKIQKASGVTINNSEIEGDNSQNVLVRCTVFDWVSWCHDSLNYWCSIYITVSLSQSEPQYVPAKFDDKASGTESDDCKSNFKQIMVYHILNESKDIVAEFVVLQIPKRFAKQPKIIFPLTDELM